MSEAVAAKAAVEQGSHGAEHRPRLLFISTRYLFPTDSGGKIRTVNVLRGLKGGRFEVTLVSPCPADDGTRDENAIAGVCDRFVGWPAAPRGRMFAITRAFKVAGELPIAVATDRSRAGRRTVETQLAAGPDLVVVDFPHAAVLLPSAFSVPSVLFTHNVETEIFARHARVARGLLRRTLWQQQTAKMERFERDSMRRFDAVIAVSERDAQHFRSECGVKTVAVIPTGVDLEYFEYRGPRPRLADAAPTIVFTGSMDWLANIDGLSYFMDDIWPLIEAQQPGVRMLVVGRAPPAGLVAAARARGLPWEFTGFVPDVRPYVHRADVFVIPLRVGGGTRIKAYEAMAMGCPVVSTSIGVEGLPLQAGYDYENADNAGEFARKVVALLDNPHRREEMALQARRFVEANFSVRQVARVFEDICWSAYVGDRAGTH